MSKNRTALLVSAFSALILATVVATAGDKAGAPPAKPGDAPAKPAATAAEKPAAAAAKPADAPAKPDALEPFRKLAGTWAGRAGEGDDAHETEMSYRVVGAGSAVVEEIARGTPHEMITVYYLDGDQLVLTHYCAMRNQPHLKAVAGDDPKIVKFDFVNGANIDPAKTPHMHSVTFHFVSDNELQTTWTSWADGKATGEHKFVLKRKGA